MTETWIDKNYLKYVLNDKSLSTSQCFFSGCHKESDQNAQNIQLIYHLYRVIIQINPAT